MRQQAEYRNYSQGAQGLPFRPLIILSMMKVLDWKSYKSYSDTRKATCILGISWKMQQLMILTGWIMYTNAKEQDGIFARKKKSLCLPRNYHIFQHFRNHQSVLEASLMEPGIGGKISKGACAFSVTYWYSFHIDISNILLDISDAAKIYATLPPGTSLSSSGKVKNEFLHPPSLEILTPSYSPPRYNQQTKRLKKSL